MSIAQKRSYENLFSKYCLDCAKIDVEQIFGNKNPLVVEIGFGMGRATVEIAEKNPFINYIGIEVHKPGIGRLLWDIEKRELGNIRIVEGDAVEIIGQKIMDASVSAFHIFFPDPWPKKRHHKRRLITRSFTGMLSTKLLSGGYLYMVTDWAEYGDFAMNELFNTPGLSNKYSGFAEPVSWRPKTEFELKGIKKDHEIKELFFTKEEVAKNNEQ